MERTLLHISRWQRVLPFHWWWGPNLQSWYFFIISFSSSLMVNVDDSGLGIFKSILLCKPFNISKVSDIPSSGSGWRTEVVKGNCICKLYNACKLVRVWIVNVDVNKGLWLGVWLKCFCIPPHLIRRLHCRHFSYDSLTMLTINWEDQQGSGPQATQAVGSFSALMWASYRMVATGWQPVPIMASA